MLATRLSVLPSCSTLKISPTPSPTLATRLVACTRRSILRKVLLALGETEALTRPVPNGLNLVEALRLPCLCSLSLFEFFFCLDNVLSELFNRRLRLQNRVPITINVSQKPWSRGGNGSGGGAGEENEEETEMDRMNGLGGGLFSTIER